MTSLQAASQSGLPLVVMQPNPAVDSKLTAKTLAYLHTTGLPTSDELGFSFTGQMLLLPNGLVRLVETPRILSAHAEQVYSGLDVCLNLQQNESLRWENEPESFINSSVEQFTQSVQAFEYYLGHVQAKEIFGPFYDNRTYANGVIWAKNDLLC